MVKTNKQGTIIKKNDERTVVVEIVGTKVHPLYRKRFKITKKYLVDDEEGKFKVGDIVLIEETRPISKKKVFRVKEKVGEANMVGREKVALKGEEISEEGDGNLKEDIDAEKENKEKEKVSK